MVNPAENGAVADEQIGDVENALSQSWSVGRLRPWLQSLARSRVSDPHEASDVVQQTLMAAWQNESRADFATSAERLAWLRTIMVNTIRRSHRNINAQKRGGEIQHVVLDETQHLPMTQEVAAKTNPMVRAEESLRLAEAIAKLPCDQRHVITRHQFDEVDYATIAAELGRSVEAIRMLKVRSLRSLRKLLMD